MPFDLPRSLSPSKVTSFRDCALAFRFNAIEHLPDEPTIWTVKGTLVHRVLERLFWHHGQGERTPAAAALELAAAWDELQTDPEYLALALPPTRPTASGPTPRSWSGTTSRWRTRTRSTRWASS